MKDPIYMPDYDANSMAYVRGPAPGGQCSYHGGSFNPESRFDTKKAAEKVAALMNIAYKEGV